MSEYLEYTSVKILESKRGAGLVDAIVTIALLSTVGVVFATTFSAGYSCLGQARDYRIATSVAQQKIEQLRSMNYESLNYSLLYSAGVIDSSPTFSPYSFTQVDNISGKLCEGTGTLEIVDIGSDVKKVRVIVKWCNKNGMPDRMIQLTTLFADKRTRTAN